MAALRVVFFLLAALLVLAIAAVGFGALRWSRETGAMTEQLVERAATPQPGPTTGLPVPVRRYLDWAIPEGKPPIRVARIRQKGEFLLSPPDGWAPFTARQLFTTVPPGMVWDARIRMAPLLSVRVRDRYGGGVGSMHGAVLGLLTVVEQEDADELAEASLLRYLAEAAWFPSRLRPSETLRWEAVDDSTATATLRDGSVAVSLEFRFDDGGEIRAVYSQRRYRGEDQDPVWAPWIGRFSDYRVFDGFRIPTVGEVSWVLDGEERPYWRGTIESARYAY